MVMAGFHDFSSSKIDKQTVPEGYTFGWNKGGTNLPVNIADLISFRKKYKGYD